MQRVETSRTYRCFPVALAAPALAVFMILALAVQAHARMVEVVWTPDDPEAEIATRAQARVVGFKRAVFAEALELVPGALAEYRAELLRQYLMPHAAEYVLSYSEAATEPEAPGENATRSDAAAVDAPQAALPGGETADAPLASLVPAAPQGVLRLEVTVNRAGLKRHLKQMGVYYTTTAAQPYDLALGGEASMAWDEIGRLQALSGVSVVRGAEPLMEIDAAMAEPTDEERKAGLKEAAPLWQARLSAGGNQWEASGRVLQDVWFGAWKGWFSRPGAEAGMVDELHLSVRGWYATDGIKAFADEMAAWEGVVESAQLREVRMLPDGMSGVFSVKTMDRAALESRLGRTLPQRGLDWDFIK